RLARRAGRRGGRRRQVTRRRFRRPGPRGVRQARPDTGRAGGALGDMVTMTVFITDARFGDRFTQLRKEIFGDNFPASALITVAGLARPEMLVEIQGIAVVG